MLFLRTVILILIFKKSPLARINYVLFVSQG